jgi:hypothetical protein
MRWTERTLVTYVQMTLVAGPPLFRRGAGAVIISRARGKDEAKAVVETS